MHRRVHPFVRRTLDIVFGSVKVAVEVRGCFWHACPEHATWPDNNAAWWRDKLEANRRRDLDTARRLAELGWELIVVWEHEDPDVAAQRVARSVRRRRVARHGVTNPG